MTGAECIRSTVNRAVQDLGDRRIPKLSLKMPSPAIAPFLGATGRMMSYRNFSEASAVGFLSAILFTVFSDPVKNLVDFGEKWLGLSALPYQMNTALLGFVAGFGLMRILLLARLQILKMLLSYQGWMIDTKSTATKIWGLMLNAIVSKNNYQTFFFEPLLPKLPVPDLNSTCDKYLASMKPILSEEDFMNLTTAVLSFKEKDGPKLQAYLHQRAATKTCWLSDIWMNLAYLRYREPCAVNVNCYATDRKDLPTNSQAHRAANTIHWVLSFHEQIIQEKLTPQLLQDMIPINMIGYKQQFCTNRIPGESVDCLRTYPESKHIIIYRRGVYYSLEAFAPDHDGKEQILTPCELLPIINKIIEETEDPKDPCQVGVFTSQKRDVWAKVRNRLIEVPVTKDSLEIVESSITVFSLDDEKPETIEENGTYTMVGNGFNRWFDKSITFQIFANAKIGTNVEHSSVDATLPGRMWEYVLTNEKYTSDGEVIMERSRKKRIPQPQRLTWNLDGFEKDLETAIEEYRKLGSKFELIVVSPEYGKGFMKQKKLSPDGYIQMAMQLAFFKLHNKIPKTYESASTRMFQEGRTETIRPVSDFSAQWVKSMQNKRATRDQRIMLLKRAILYQTQVKIDASIGYGWDRHLIGLFAISQELHMKPPPALFQDKSFWLPDDLSTSQTPTKYTYKWRLENCCMGGGFGPAYPEGYGISYMIYGEDLIKFHVTTDKHCSFTSAPKMADAILDAMNDMKELLS